MTRRSALWPSRRPSTIDRMLGHHTARRRLVALVGTAMLMQSLGSSGVDGATGVVLTPVVSGLDISDKVSTGGERGLLGLAFHPKYKVNGRFYVDFTRTSDGATSIDEYHVSSTDPDVATRVNGRRRFDAP